MRITVESILDYLAVGDTPEEIVRQHPMLEPEDISACLAFASRLMAHKYNVKAAAGWRCLIDANLPGWFSLRARLGAR